MVNNRKNTKGRTLQRIICKDKEGKFTGEIRYIKRTSFSKKVLYPSNLAEVIRHLRGN